MVAILPFFLLTYCCCIVFTVVNGDAAPIGSVPMRVMNHAGASIELYWNDVFSVKPGEEMKLVLQTPKPIRNSSDTTIHSYNTHEFVVRFFKHVKDGPQVRFTKGPNEETVNIHYDASTKTMSVIQRTKFDELMDKVKEATVSCDDYIGDRFADCISQLVIKDISKITESKDIIASYRDIMSNRLRNYICSDLSANITQSLKNTTYTEKGFTSSSTTTSNTISNNNDIIPQNTFEIQNVLDSSHAKIFVIDNFMSETECQTLRTHHDAHITPPLTTITTIHEGDGLRSGGGGIISNATFSLQNNHGYEYSAVIKALHRRVTALYNHKTISGHIATSVLGAVASEGQEDVYTQHYHQKAELLPQCDYESDEDGGRLVEEGERIATAVLQCQTPTVGGLMVFPRADVILRPKPYSVVIISYIGGDGRLEEGLTQRSECPVIEGEKFQAVVHLRRGVSFGNPWHSFIEDKHDKVVDDDDDDDDDGSVVEVVKTQEEEKDDKKRNADDDGDDDGNDEL